MGQDFRIVAPHERETSPNMGKLGEFFLDGSAAWLVNMLVVPSVPDDFGLISSSKPVSEEVQGAEQEHGCLLQPSLDLKHSRDEKSDDVSVGVPRKKAKLHTSLNSRIAPTPATFSSLPKEVHDLIFRELDFVDVFFLGLTSRYLWNIARRLIGTFYASFIGNWVGQNIICVGHYTDPLDVPSGFLTEQEKTELLEGFDEDDLYSDDEDACSKDDIGKPQNLYKLASVRYLNLGNRELPTLRGISLNHGIARIPKEVDWRTLHMEEQDFHPKASSWTLRNLTTHKYVRSESIDRRGGSQTGPHIGPPGFGEAVLSRICWSTDPNLSMAHNGTSHRGVWAGHCFDIITWDTFENEGLRGTEWKDVSEEVADELFKIWESNGGDDQQYV